MTNKGLQGFQKGHPQYNHNKGRKQSREQIEKNRLSHIGIKVWNDGLTKSDPRISKQVEKRMREGKYAHTEKTKHILSIRTTNNPNRYWLGKHRSEEDKKRMRISAWNYIRKTYNASPRVGRNEDKIMNAIQTTLNTPVERNFYVDGYFCDGYCKELNIVFEVDEEYHFVNNQLSEKDLRRQDNIIKTLNCKFIRIRERDFLKNSQETLQSLGIPVVVGNSSLNDGCTQEVSSLLDKSMGGKYD